MLVRAKKASSVPVGDVEAEEGGESGVEPTGTACIVEPDRRRAIELAIRSATPGDIVLLAGKGHEKVQILASGTIPFDDAAVAADIVQNM